MVQASSILVFRTGSAFAFSASPIWYFSRGGGLFISLPPDPRASPLLLMETGRKNSLGFLLIVRFVGNMLRLSWYTPFAFWCLLFCSSGLGSKQEAINHILCVVCGSLVHRVTDATMPLDLQNWSLRWGLAHQWVGQQLPIGPFPSLHRPADGCLPRAPNSSVPLWEIQIVCRLEAATQELRRFFPFRQDEAAGVVYILFCVPIAAQPKVRHLLDLARTRNHTFLKRGPPVPPTPHSPFPWYTHKPA